MKLGMDPGHMIKITQKTGSPYNIQDETVELVTMGFINSSRNTHWALPVCKSQARGGGTQ